MAKKKETLFKEQVLFDLKKIPRTWFVKTQMVSIRGVPDILACIGGRFVAIELKRSKTLEASKLQAFNLGKINQACGLGITVGPEDWMEVFELLYKLGKESE